MASINGNGSNGNVQHTVAILAPMQIPWTQQEQQLFKQGQEATGTSGKSLFSYLRRPPAKGQADDFTLALSNVIRLAPQHYFASMLAQETSQTLASGSLTRLELLHVVAKFHISSLKDGTGGMERRDTGIIPMDTVRAITAKIDNGDFTSDERAFARNTLNKYSNELIFYDTLINSLGCYARGDIISDRQRMGDNFDDENRNINSSTVAASVLRKGIFLHEDRVFHNKDDKRFFSKMLSPAMSKLLVNCKESRMSEREVKEAVEMLAERIATHDEQCVANRSVTRRLDVTARARYMSNGANGKKPKPPTSTDAVEAARAQQEAQKLRADIQRQEAARQAHVAFMAEPHPYEVSPEATKVIHAVHGVAGTLSSKAQAVKIVERGVQQARDVLDTRKESLKELGDLLLTPASLQAMVKSAGLESEVKQLTPRPLPKLNERATRLRLLYKTSEDVREAVGKLLNSDAGIMLLAVQTRSSEQCKKYAQTLQSIEIAQKPVDAEIAKIRGKYEGLNDHVLMHEFKTDSDVKTLISKRDKRKDNLVTQRQNRKQLASEIRSVFDGVAPKQVANSALNDAVAERTDVELSVPSFWLTHTNGHFHLSEPAEGEADKEKFVAVHDNENPALNRVLKKNLSEDALKNALKEFKDECIMHKTADALMEELSARGFAVEGNEFKHKEYGITVPLSLQGSAREKVLEEAQKAFEVEWTKQESLLTSLSYAGVEVKRPQDETSQATTLTLQDGKKVVLENEWFSAQDTALLQGILSAQEMQAASEAAPVIQDGGKRQWTPGKDDTLIHFDANTLMRLSVKRGQNGHTWLDMVQETARLPGVKVVVSGVMGLQELRGMIPTKTHEGFRFADERFAPGGTLAGQKETFDAFFSKAAKGELGKDGSIELTGPDSNIILLSTPGDMEWYKKIQDIVLKAPEKARPGLSKQYIHKHNEGEESTRRIIEGLPGTNHAVVTDDARFVNGIDADGNPTKPAPRHTSSGMPVVYAGTGSYLQAELESSPERYAQLRANLKEPGLSLPNITNDIVRQGRGLERGNDPLMYKATIGIHPSSGAGVTLHTIIQDAARRQEEQGTSAAGDAQPWVQRTNGTSTGVILGK